MTAFCSFIDLGSQLICLKLSGRKRISMCTVVLSFFIYINCHFSNLKNAKMSKCTTGANKFAHRLRIHFGKNCRRSAMVYPSLSVPCPLLLRLEVSTNVGCVQAIFEYSVVSLSIIFFKFKVVLEAVRFVTAVLSIPYQFSKLTCLILDGFCL